jgi:hypothetical protein
MSTITINWLNKCRCGNKSHTVKTVRGNETGLWDDDAVKCNSCGRGGVIQVCEGQARVLWETDEEMAEGKSMSTITREFTKEQLIARIHQVTAINKYRISRDPDADGLAMDNELLAIALVSFEAEPVCYLTWHQGFRAPDDCEEYVVEAKPGDKSCDGSPAFPYTPPRQHRYLCPLRWKWMMTLTARLNTEKLSAGTPIAPPCFSRSVIPNNSTLR